MDVCLAIRYDRRISPVSQKIRGLPFIEFPDKLLLFFVSFFSLLFLSPPLPSASSRRPSDDWKHAKSAN